MGIKFQLSKAILFCAIFFAGFCYLAYSISVNGFLTLDDTVISIVQGWESPILTNLMKFFTTIGSANVVILTSLGILFFLYKVLNYRSELVLFIVVMIGSPVLNWLLKAIFQRARPDLQRLIDIGGYSFPSGHAMNAFTFYGILSFLLWRHISTKWGRSLLIVISTLMILMIGISRIYLGVHYPSDILGGYLGSGCWLTLTIWTFQYYKEKQYEREMLLHE